MCRKAISVPRWVKDRLRSVQSAKGLCCSGRGKVLYDYSPLHVVWLKVLLKVAMNTIPEFVPVKKGTYWKVVDHVAALPGTCLLDFGAPRTKGCLVR